MPTSPRSPDAGRRRLLCGCAGTALVLRAGGSGAAEPPPDPRWAAEAQAMKRLAES